MPTPTARRWIGAVLCGCAWRLGTPVAAEWTRLWGEHKSDEFSSAPSAALQPLRRAAHALVAHEDSLYVFGGLADTASEEDHEFADTWRFDLESKHWAMVNPDTDPSDDATTSSSSSSSSGGGGSSAGGAATALNSSRPSHRFHHAAAVHANASVSEMIVFGGLSILPPAAPENASAPAPAASPEIRLVQFNEVWRLRLQPGNETWSLDEPTGNASTSWPPPRSEAGVVVHDGQLYVFGGIAYDEAVEREPVDYNDLWRYDLSERTWHKLAPAVGDDGTPLVPPARFSHSFSKFTDADGDTYLFVFSGRHLDFASWSLLGDAWLFSLKTQSWTAVTLSSRLQRAYTSVVMTGGDVPSMWFFGGYYKPQQGTNGYVYDDVVSGQLSLQYAHQQPPAPGQDAAALPLRGAEMKLFRGVTDPELALPPLRYNHKAALWRDCMVVHGGSYQTQRGDVWMYNLTSAVLRDDAAAALPLDMETLIYVLGGFVFSIILVLVLLIIRWRRIDRRNIELARMRGVAAMRGVAKERLDQMAITKYKKPPQESKPGATSTVLPAAAATLSEIDGDANNEDVCPICLIEFEEEEDVRNLPCKHIFHVACIDEWLKRNTTCPMCKNNLDLQIVDVEPAFPASAAVPRQARPSRASRASSSAVAYAHSSGTLQVQTRGGAMVTPVMQGPS